MATRGKPNHRLQIERRKRGWTQVQLVDRMYRAANENKLPLPRGLDNNYISKYERGVSEPSPHHVHLMCLAFDLPSDQLGLQGGAAPHAGTMDAGGYHTQRREFLKVIGGGVAAALVNDGTSPGAPNLLVDAQPLSAVERVALGDMLGHNIERAWELFHSADAEHMLVVARAQLYMLKLHHAALNPDLLPSYYSLVYRLVGATHHRHGQFGEALRAHDNAYLAALEGGDAWNMAESRSWQAYGMTAMGQHAESLQAIEAALRLLSEQGNPASIRLQARLLSSAANTAAALGDAKQADSMLHASEALLDRLPGLHEEFDHVAWLESAGVCALRLGRLESATTSLQQALSEVPVQWVARRVFTTIALAMAFAHRRDRDAALAVARDAVPQLKAARSRELTDHFVGFLRHDLYANFPNDGESRLFADEAGQALVTDG